MHAYYNDELTFLLEKLPRKSFLYNYLLIISSHNIVPICITIYKYINIIYSVTAGLT